MGQHLHLIGSGLDSRLLKVCRFPWGVGLNQTDVVEKEFVAAGGSQLALFEKDPNLWGGAVVIIGEDLSDDRDFVRGVTFEGNVFEGDFFSACSGPLGNSPLDGVSRDAFLAGFF